MRARTIPAAALIFAAGTLPCWSAVPEPLRTTVVAQESKPDPRAKPAPTFTPDQLAERAIHRRAVEAAIWGIPAVNTDLMLQALKRDAKGDINQIVYWSRPLDWKCQTLTPNPDAIYFMPFWSTKDVGPIVVEVPPPGAGRSPAV
jgi:hypothetical protein